MRHVDNVCASPTALVHASSSASLHPFDEDQHPFDERPSNIPLVSRSGFPPPVWQTVECIQAFASLPVSQVHILQRQDGEEDDVFAGLVASPDHSVQQLSPRSQQPRAHPWNLNRPFDQPTTPPTLLMTPQHTTQPPSPPRPLRMPFLSTVEPIGPPGSQVYKVTLPHHLVSLLDPLVAVAEAHAQQQQGGWASNLYSLTRQDLPLADVPGAVTYSRPIVDYLTTQMQILYQCRCVWMDRNQPHLLKYSARTGYSGVGLHTDACDVTANLMMSRPTDYYGGGTWLDDPCHCTVHLNQGECLLHPGSIRHAGQAIQSGTRFCMVLFGFFELPPPPPPSPSGTPTNGSPPVSISRDG